MKLYYVPMTRSGRPRWMLEELGVPYELVRLDPSKGDTKTPEYLAANPLGHVPAFTDGGVTFAESAGIVLYLADKYPEKKMAPAPGTPERGLYYQWGFLAMGTLEPQVAAYSRLVKAEAEAARLEEERKKFHALAAPLEKALAGRTFILGDAFGAADVVLGGVVMWARRQKMFGAAELPNLEAYVGRLRERPAFLKSSSD